MCDLNEVPLTKLSPIGSFLLYIHDSKINMKHWFVVLLRSISRIGIEKISKSHNVFSLSELKGLL